MGIRVMAVKENGIWEEVFNELTSSPARRAHLVFSEDPRSIIPMIRQGLEYEAQKLQESGAEISNYD